MRTFLTKLRWMTRRRSREAELHAELAFHLHEEAEEARARGVPEREALLLARRELGNRGRVLEDTRAAWGWTWIEHLVKDLGYAARLLRRRPVFSATAILTLTLGIGGATAILGLLDALLLKSLPVSEPEKLMRLVERRAEGAFSEAFTVVTHDLLRRGSEAFSGVIAGSRMTGRPDEIELTGDLRKPFVQFVSDNYFDVLGLAAFRGRLFTGPAPERPREPVAVISHEYWRSQFGGDASALGATFRRRNREFTIVGIAPRGFRGTEIDVPVDIWLPIEEVVPPNSPDRAAGRWIGLIGRLRSGVEPAFAEAETSALLGRAVQLQPGGIGYSNLRFRLYRPLLLLAIVVMLVLLIGCANLANLTLAATAARDREIAVRAAIGASRGRIIRQLVTESLMLAMLGGALGLAFARFANSALLAFLPPGQAIAAANLRLEIDGRVLGLVVLLSFGTSLLFGILPALRVTGKAGAGALKMGPGLGRRHGSALSRALLIGQVAVCAALLIVAGVFVRTLANLRTQEAGYREDHLLVAQVEFPRAYNEARRDRLIEELRQRTSGLPAVQVAAFSHLGQLSGGAIEFRIGVPGRTLPESDAITIEQRVSPGLFQAMGTAFVAGRDFRPSDDERAPQVAIVNQSFARRFLPGIDPLGARFYREGGSRSGELMEVVGVVRDSKWINLRDDAPPMYYRPYGQAGGAPAVQFAIRTSGDPSRLAAELIQAAHSIDRQMALNNVVPFREIVNRTLVTERLVANVSSAFGALALLIAAVGLYGVLAYAVVQRRHEIGLRIAVGAQPATVERMFLRESLNSVALGVAVGIPIGIASARLASSMLFGLSPHDPVSIIAAAAALIAVSVTSAWFPARAAARTDPAIALRQD